MAPAGRTSTLPLRFGRRSYDVICERRSGQAPLFSLFRSAPAQAKLAGEAWCIQPARVHTLARGRILAFLKGAACMPEARNFEAGLLDFGLEDLGCDIPGDKTANGFRLLRCFKLSPVVEESAPPDRQGLTTRSSGCLGGLKGLREKSEVQVCYAPTSLLNSIRS